MTIDELGRAAGTAARRGAAADVDSATMLRQLDTTHRRRRTVAAASVALLVVGGSLVVRASLQNPERTSTPGSTPTGSTTTTSPSPSSPCAAGKTCQVSGRTYWVGLPTPVRLTLPDRFQPGIKHFGEATFEVYRNDVDDTGVSVVENAIPVRNDVSLARDPSAGTTAAEMAIWLSNRSFLEHTTVQRTSLGGRIAWRVTGDFRPGSTLGLRRSVAPRAPVFKGDSGTTGFSSDLKGECTLIDTPGSGVTVVWSWTLRQPKTAIVGNRSLIASLTFGSPQPSAARS